MTHKKLTISLVIVITVVLMFVATACDLLIAAYIYRPDALWAIIIEVVAELPSLVITCTMCSYLFFYFRSMSGRLRATRCILCAVGGLGGITYVVTALLRYLGLTSDNFSAYYVTVILGIAALAAILTLIAHSLRRLVLARGVDEPMLVHIMLSCIIAALATLVIINAVKIPWGRWRYRDILATGDTALSAFTPWYKPCGITGQRSFPSGHCANTMLLLFAVYFNRMLPAKSRARILTTALPLMLLAVVAAARLTLGAHYLSDTVMGSFIAFWIVYVVGAIRKEI